MRSTNKIQNSDGITKQSTQIIPKILSNNEDIFIRSNPAISLYILADKYYGDSDLWWIIARANNINSFIVTDGRLLRIPIRPEFSINKD